MKSIKTNPNCAKGPDKGNIVSKLYCILLTTLEFFLIIIFLEFLVSNLKEISPSVFSWKKIRYNSTVKIRFGRKKILNYAYVLKNGVCRYSIFFLIFKLGDGYPEHILVENNCSFCGVRVARSLTLCVCFVDRCLCAVCSSSSYGFWLLLGYLQTLLIDNWNNFQRIVLEDKHILERKVVFYIHRRWFICYDHCHDRMCFGFTYILPSLVPITTNDMS